MADSPTPIAPVAPEPRKRDFRLPSRETGIAIFIRGIVPIVAALLVYALVGQAKADLTTLESLIQLAIALIAGVAIYTIITDVRVERLPERLSGDLADIERKLQPVESRLIELTEQLGNLSDAIDNQFKRLADQHGMEMLFNQAEALEKARTLQDSAKNRVDAMWTFLPYDDVLQQYFTETLVDGSIFTRRIVAARNVPLDHLLDHIEKTWDRLASQTYEIHLVPDCNFEIVITDREKAALFIYSVGYGCCYMSSSTKQFIDAVEGLADGLRRAEWKLPIEKGASKKDGLAKVRTWLDNYYANMS
jgi:hypothetical protein